MTITKLNFDKDLYSKSVKLLIFPDYRFDGNLKKKLTSRWENENDRLEKVLKDLKDNKSHWDSSLKKFGDRGEIKFLESGGGVEPEIPFSPNIDYNLFTIPTKITCEYKRDLRGTYWSDVQLEGKLLESFSNCLLDYCVFEDCKFHCMTGKLSFKNCVFMFCDFSNSFFTELDISESVFLACKFSKTRFNRIKEQKNIIFLDCKFDKIDLSNFDHSEIYFDQGCEFQDIQLYGDIIKKLEIIGQNVIKQINLFENNNDIKGYKSVEWGNQYYFGYSNFIKALLVQSNKTYDYSYALIYEYYWIVYFDKARIKKKYGLFAIKYFFGKYIIGYGYSYWKPLLSFVLVNIIFSIAFLFSGIVVDGKVINRSLSFSINELKSTFTDWLNCFSFSSLTSLTINYGDAYPLGNASRLLSIMLGFIEIILLTIFIITFARRYFK